MKCKILYFLALFFICHPADAQKVREVYPTPQHMIQREGETAIPTVYQLAGEAKANPYAVKKLQALLKGEVKKGSKFTIYIGKKGDKAVRKYNRFIPQHPDGYYLLSNANTLVLAGNDERGTYYAVETLSQLIEDGKLPFIEVKDYPVVPFRGVVEGFYGTPWSHEARLRQLKFYGENKLNTYIYGPKDDPFHSCPNWRKPYPEKEAIQISELVKAANENAVDFVWAIHPGQDIKWNEEDRNLLLAKFEKMYQLGVRSFAVFFDDISGEGTNPARQAELLNYIDDHFVKVKKDVTPLIMCPTEYNKSWSDPAKGYLTTLGSQLNPSIHIMWTGDRVISTITREGIAWINEKIKRPAYIWWNFPVSDYVRDHLLMGPVYGNDTTIGREMSGFVSNPMEHAEASKVAVFCVADYAWNPEKYNSLICWKEAIHRLLPGGGWALEVFATHNSDLGPNGHGFRRDESVNIQPVAKRFTEACQKGEISENDRKTLEDEFKKMVEAADILLVNQENTALIEEMRPWLYQFKLLGETGCEVMGMVKAYADGNRREFMRKYNHVKALQQQSFAVDQTYNQNPYQPGIKTGSKIMQPLAEQAFAAVTRQYNQKYGMQLDATVRYTPHKLTSNVEQFKNLPLQVKTNRVMVTPMLEVVKWPAGQYITIELDKTHPLRNTEIDFGVKDVDRWGRLEVSADGKVWKNIPFTQNGNVLKANLGMPAKYLRFSNQSDRQQEVYMRKFILVLGD